MATSLSIIDVVIIVLLIIAAAAVISFLWPLVFVNVVIGAAYYIYKWYVNKR